MNKKKIILGVIIVIAVMVIAFLFACRLPDGLEKIAGDKGFLEKESKPLVRAPLADYLWPGIKNERMSMAVSGIAGILIVSLVSFCAGLLLRRAKK